MLYLEFISKMEGINSPKRLKPTGNNWQDGKFHAEKNQLS
jgi:hypothetical protein